MENNVISLSKGEKISLSKDVPGFTHLDIGLGWNPQKREGEKFDLDAYALILDADSNLLDGAASFIYFDNRDSKCGAINLSEDNKDGEGDGDDEIIKIDFTKLPQAVSKILIAVGIHEASERGQNFGRVDEPEINLYESGDETPKYNYELGEENALATCVVYAEIYRHKDEWKYAIKDEAVDGGIGSMLTSYGMQVS
ncbi:TerD family protein [Vibrio splendidus]